MLLLKDFRIQSQKQRSWAMAIEKAQKQRTTERQMVSQMMFQMENQTVQGSLMLFLRGFEIQ